MEKLAEQSGHDPIDAAALQEAIDTYNGYCADGVDADFHRAEKPNMYYGEPALVALGEPPYYACQVSPCAIYTIGGLHWGPGGATLDWDGNPIPGLYAAGDVASRLRATRICMTGNIVTGDHAAKHAMGREDHEA